MIFPHCYLPSIFVIPRRSEESPPPQSFRGEAEESPPLTTETPRRFTPRGDDRGSYSEQSEESLPFPHCHSERSEESPLFMFSCKRIEVLFGFFGLFYKKPEPMSRLQKESISLLLWYRAYVEDDG